jgi:hypothetical protein
MPSSANSLLHESLLPQPTIILITLFCNKNNYIKADISLKNMSVVMETILVSFLQILYFWKPLNDLASYDTVTSPCYLHFI